MYRPLIIAFYLPQYYPFKENNEWWGAGFTEWTNVGKAKPLFHDHYQPKVPADLSYYDLRVPEVREQQAALAKEAGVYGFCYWHYWFGNGMQLLQRVFDEVIESGKPDFPICLGWANHSWYSKTWDKNGTDKLLMEQKYEGTGDYYTHFLYAIKAFKDSRYIRIQEKPVFFIYDAMALPDDFIPYWNKLAQDNGLNGICFIGRISKDEDYDNALKKGFSYVTSERINDVSLTKTKLQRRFHQFKHKLQGRPRNCYTYKEAYPYFLKKGIDDKPLFIPSLIPCWDHSPRSKSKGLILHNSTPELFREHIKQTFNLIKNRPVENQILFLKSWNEWAEGNYMEPDLKWGKKYIQVLSEEIQLYNQNT